MKSYIFWIDQAWGIYNTQNEFPIIWHVMWPHFLGKTSFFALNINFSATLALSVMSFRIPLVGHQGGHKGLFNSFIPSPPSSRQKPDLVHPRSLRFTQSFWLAKWLFLETYISDILASFKNLRPRSLHLGWYYMFLTKIAQYILLWQRNLCLKLAVFQSENERSISPSSSLLCTVQIIIHKKIWKIGALHCSRTVLWKLQFLFL